MTSIHQDDATLRVRMHASGPVLDGGVEIARDARGLRALDAMRAELSSVAASTTPQDAQACTLAPFADDAAVLDLSPSMRVENGTATLRMRGTLDVGDTPGGRARLAIMLSLLDAARATLRAVPDLPETALPTGFVDSVANPFA